MVHGDEGWIKYCLKRIVKRSEVSALLDTGRLEIGDLYASGYIALCDARNRRNDSRGQKAYNSFVKNTIYWTMREEVNRALKHRPKDSNKVEPDSGDLVPRVDRRERILRWLDGVGFSPEEIQIVWKIHGEGLTTEETNRKLKVGVWRIGEVRKKFREAVGGPGRAFSNGSENPLL